MKKITGLFLAILPFFVLVLLFVSGFIIKSNITIHVSSVNIVQNDFAKKVADLSDPGQTLFGLDARISPSNANNQTLKWWADDQNVIQVNNEGDAKAIGYGETYVYAQSQDDTTKIDRVKVEIYDTQVHDISIANSYELSYVNLNASTKINVDTVPANHIINKDLKFESSDDTVLTVTTDGWVIPHKLGTAQVKVTCVVANGQKITKNVDVKVGTGVEKVELKNQAATVTDLSIFNMRDEIITYPETDQTIIKNDDFEYTVSDSQIAEVSPLNNIIFKTQDPVTITACYKRNKDLKVSKTVRSTCNNILSVNFGANEYTETLTVKQEGTSYSYEQKDISSLIKLNVYPSSDNLFKDLTIESSNPSVVKSEFDLSSSNWKITALKPGTATLLVSAGTGSTTQPYKFDACLVTILSPIEHDYAIIKSNEVQLENGNFYYSLLQNLTLDIADKSAQKITFKVIDGDAAMIDDNNILQFTKAGTVKIKVYGDEYSTSATFTVTAIDELQEITYEESKDTYSIEAGKRYKFKNVTPIFDDKSYKDKFNYDATGNFNAICGQNILEFEIKTSSGDSKTIKLIVSERPSYINYDINTYYSTSETEIDFANLTNASVVPSTALKTNGDTYKLTYTYTPESETTASVEGDTITFKQAGLVDVAITCDDIASPSVFKIKSTFGGLDKFEVYNGAEIVPSNKTIDLAPNNELQLTISGLTYAEASQVQIESSSDTKLCETSKEITGGSFRGYTATFTIKALNNMYGIETFALRTKAYATYVNINVTSEIQGFEVNYNNQILKSGVETTDINLTFVNSLELNVLPYPLVAKDQTYTTTLDGTSISHEGNKIKLSGTELTVGVEHKLVFSWTNAKTTQTKTYKLKYVENYEGLLINISESTADKNLYLASNNTTITYHLTANGLLPIKFFEQTDKFQAILSNPRGASTKIKSNILSIEGLPIASGAQFTDTLTLLYSGTTVLGTYKITRDIVSKVVLPKHDNNDLTDKKGMQKVHVYGNLSYYTKEEGLIDFYKLPVQIYDYKGDEIVNTEEDPHVKTEVMKTMNISIDKNCNAEYDEKLDCIKVKFNATNFYDEVQMSNNEFDAKDGNKNVTINVSTKSENAKSNYTFVTVKGINTYCEEALQIVNDKKVTEVCQQKGYANPSLTIVLQTNFGLEDKSSSVEITKDCMHNLPGLYGNGYTIDLDSTYTKYKSAVPGICFALNVTLQGVHDSNYAKYKSEYNSHVSFKEENDYSNYFFKYSTYKNFLWGFEATISGKYKMSYYSDSLFYNNKVSSIYINDPDNYKTTIEHCIFLDTGSFPILITENGSVYLKGYIGIYNFHSEEMLKDIKGYDLTFMWPVVREAAKNANMSEIGADGREYINSFMVNALTDNVYFWNSKTKQYEKGVKGTPDAANFIAKYIDLKIPLTKINLSLWATNNKTVSPDAFSYYDEFDQEGNIKPEFFRTQIKKLTRNINYF